MFLLRSEAVVQRCFLKKVFLKFRKIRRKTPVSESLFLLKKRLWHRCFPENFSKFLRTPFLQNTSGGCFCYVLDDHIFYYRCLKAKAKDCMKILQNSLPLQKRSLLVNNLPHPLCFPVNFVISLRKAFLQNTLEQLLKNIES